MFFIKKNLGCNFGKQKLYFLYLVEGLSTHFKYKTYSALFITSDASALGKECYGWSIVLCFKIRWESVFSFESIIPFFT